MKIFTEKSLTNFEFWSQAKENALGYTYEELEEIEYILEDLYPQGISETTLNDIFWFETDWLNEMLGKGENEDEI